MSQPRPDSPVTRGFGSVCKLLDLTRSPTLDRLFTFETVQDERHRDDILTEIHRYIASRTDQGRPWDRWEHDLARFIPILEIVPVGVRIATATEDTPAPRYYGGY